MSDRPISKDRLDSVQATLDVLTEAGVLESFTLRLTDQGRRMLESHDAVVCACRAVVAWDEPCLQIPADLRRTLLAAIDKAEP